MTALDVHAVEAGPRRQLGRLNVRFLQTVEVLVGYQRIVCRQIVLGIQNAAVMGDHRLRQPARLAVTTGVRQLDHQHDFVSERPPRGPSGLGHQPRKRLHTVGVQAQLLRVRSSLVQNRRGLEPDQPRSPFGISPVAAKAQRAR